LLICRRTFHKGAAANTGEGVHSPPRRLHASVAFAAPSAGATSPGAPAVRVGWPCGCVCAACRRLMLANPWGLQSQPRSCLRAYRPRVTPALHVAGARCAVQRGVTLHAVAARSYAAQHTVLMRQCSLSVRKVFTGRSRAVRAAQRPRRRSGAAGCVPNRLCCAGCGAARPCARSSASADWRQCSQGVHAPQTRRLDRAAPCTRVVAVHGARLAACAAQSAAGPPAHAWQLQHMRALTLVSVPSQRRRAGPAAAMPLLQGSQARILPFEWRATQRCARAGACRSSVRLTHLSSPVALRSHRRPCQQRLRRCCRTANVRTQLQGKRGLRRGAPMARLAVAASVLTTVAAAPERTAAAVLSEYQGAGPCARAAHGCWHCRC
jgi:hypothetical protein